MRSLVALLWLAACQVAPEVVEVPFNTRVTLDVTRADEEGTWQLDARPAGSATRIEDPAARRPRFFADLPGTYLVVLRSASGPSVAELARVEVRAVNYPPVISLPTVDGVLVASTYNDLLLRSVVLDPNREEVAVTYRLTEVTAEIAPVLAVESGVARFRTVLPGRSRLVVDATDPHGATAHAEADVVAGLGYRVFEAEAASAIYSRAVDQLVFDGFTSVATFAPLEDTLHRLEASSAASVRLADDGNRFIGYRTGDYAVFRIDPLAELAELPSTVNRWPVLVGDRAYHVGPADNLAYYDLATGMTGGASGPFGELSAVVAGRRVYTVTSGNELARWDLADEVPRLEGSPRPGFPPGRFFADRERVVWHTGAVYAVADAVADDLTPLGSLPEHRSVDHSTRRRQFAVVPVAAVLDAPVDRVDLYDDTTLEPMASLPLPPVDGATDVVQVERAFFTADERHLVVVVRASDSLASGVTTIPLP